MSDETRTARMRATRAALLIRAVAAGAGIVLLVLPETLYPGPFLLELVGIVAAVALPRLVGSVLATAGFVLAWLSSGGWSADPSVVRTAVAAAVLYVLHVSTALAACVPLGAGVDRVVLVRWVRRCVVPVVLAAAVVAIDEAAPRARGWAGFELVGLVGAVLAAAAAGYAVRRRITRAD